MDFPVWRGVYVVALLLGAMSSKIPGSGGPGWLRGTALGWFGDTEEKVKAPFRNPSRGALHLAPQRPRAALSRRVNLPAGSDGSGVCALVSGMSGADPVLNFRESLRCFPHFP